MNSEDFEHEEFGVTKAVCLSFHGFDFVVGSFEWSGGDRVVVPCKDAPGMKAKGLGKLHEHTDAG